MVTNIIKFSSDISDTVLAIGQLNAQILYYNKFIMSLHVSSTVMLIIGRSNCIIQHLVSSHL